MFDAVAVVPCAALRVAATALAKVGASADEVTKASSLARTLLIVAVVVCVALRVVEATLNKIKFVENFETKKVSSKSLVLTKVGIDDREARPVVTTTLRIAEGALTSVEARSRSRARMFPTTADAA